MQDQRKRKSIKILYEDDCYVAFDKPTGMLVIPAPNKENRTLTDIVNQEFSKKEQYSLHPCHRLDRDTSGVILYAKGKKNQRLMMDEFKKYSVQKLYIALVHGQLLRMSGEIKSMIRDFDQKRYNRDALAKFAITRYTVLEKRKKYSILEVYPKTGRTNQIRIQFSELGHPLLGERKYAFARDFSIKFKRTALHARMLRWIHPVKHTAVTVNSPLPQDMELFVRNNR